MCSPIQARVTQRLRLYLFDPPATCAFIGDCITIRDCDCIRDNTVCVHVYVYVYTCVCIVYMYVYTVHVHMYVIESNSLNSFFKLTCTRTCTYTHTHTHTQCAYMYVHACTFHASSPCIHVSTNARTMHDSLTPQAQHACTPLSTGVCFNIMCTCANYMYMQLLFFFPTLLFPWAPHLTQALPIFPQAPHLTQALPLCEIYHLLAGDHVHEYRAVLGTRHKHLITGTPRGTRDGRRVTLGRTHREGGREGRRRKGKVWRKKRGEEFYSRT